MPRIHRNVFHLRETIKSELIKRMGGSTSTVRPLSDNILARPVPKMLAWPPSKTVFRLHETARLQ